MTIIIEKEGTSRTFSIELPEYDFEFENALRFEDEPLDIDPHKSGTEAPS